MHDKLTAALIKQRDDAWQENDRLKTEARMMRRQRDDANRAFYKAETAKFIEDPDGGMFHDQSIDAPPIICTECLWQLIKPCGKCDNALPEEVPCDKEHSTIVNVTPSELLAEAYRDIERWKEMHRNATDEVHILEKILKLKQSVNECCDSSTKETQS